MFEVVAEGVFIDRGNLITNIPKFRRCAICLNIYREELCDQPVLVDNTGGYACNKCMRLYGKQQVALNEA